MKSILISAGLACAAMGWAAQTDYMPLQVGNEWVLQTASSTPELLHIEVLRARAVDGKNYYLVSGYAPGERWLRKADDGTIYALDEKTGAEEVLARLATGSGAYNTSLSGCQQSAQTPAQTSVYRGPNYQKEGVLAVSYAPESCRDIGITQEAYAPDLGLVRRSITTIRGEIAYDLVYARVNGSAAPGKSGEIVLVSPFRSGSKGWLAGFSDYSLHIGDLRMLAELRSLPQEAGQQSEGFYLQSMNRSDDVFMFLKKYVSTDEGLQPNQAYRVSFDIRFWSNAPTGCIGIGGSPGDSVYLKAGASLDEPVASLAGGGDIHLSVDKGQQAVGGKDAGVIGTIANGTQCEGTNFPYVRVRKEYAHPAALRTDERGSLWLLVGTDSAFEGLTGLYYESITVRVNPAVEPAN